MSSGGGSGKHFGADAEAGWGTSCLSRSISATCAASCARRRAISEAICVSAICLSAVCSSESMAGSLDAGELPATLPASLAALASSTDEAASVQLLWSVTLMSVEMASTAVDRRENPERSSHLRRARARRSGPCTGLDAMAEASIVEASAELDSPERSHHLCPRGRQPCPFGAETLRHVPFAMCQKRRSNEHTVGCTPAAGARSQTCSRFQTCRILVHP